MDIGDTKMTDGRENKILVDTIDKLRTVSPITDEELKVSIKVLKPMVEILYKLGQRYVLVASDLREVHDTLEGSQESRRRK